MLVFGNTNEQKNTHGLHSVGNAVQITCFLIIELAPSPRGLKNGWTFCSRDTKKIRYH